MSQLYLLAPWKELLQKDDLVEKLIFLESIPAFQMPFRLLKIIRKVRYSRLFYTLTYYFGQIFCGRISFLAKNIILQKNYFFSQKSFQTSTWNINVLLPPLIVLKEGMFMKAMKIELDTTMTLFFNRVQTSVPNLTP